MSSAVRAPRSTAPRRAEPRAAAPRPQLTVVRAIAPARTTLPFLVLVVLLLVSALLAPMILNAQMARTAYAMQRSQIELNEVEDHTETLRTQVQEASSPGHLAMRAAALGMVPAAAPGDIVLSDGTISGGEPAAPPAPAAAPAADAPSNSAQPADATGGTGQ